jgi:hypothetical protein
MSVTLNENSGGAAVSAIASRGRTVNFDIQGGPHTTVSNTEAQRCHWAKHSSKNGPMLTTKYGIIVEFETLLLC